MLYESGKYKELLDQYEAALDDLPDDNKPEVLILAANSKRQSGDFAGAARSLRGRSSRIYPTSPYADEAKYEHLVSLYNAGDPSLIPADGSSSSPAIPMPTKRDQVTLLKAEALFKDEKYADAAPVYASLEDSTLSLPPIAPTRFSSSAGVTCRPISRTRPSPR